MRVISSNEFSANQEKYFDLAENEDVCINRGNIMFRLMCTPFETQYPEQEILEPDEDLRNAITMDELLDSTIEFIHKLYAKK